MGGLTPEKSEYLESMRQQMSLPKETADKVGAAGGLGGFLVLLRGAGRRAGVEGWERCGLWRGRLGLP